eukprot:TRINITY_DN38336_c0_g1_i1.p1 TRINITY_DN38336_c0_g1~~TRINITY_DN38336_c0_g1_i1.p1  ORF type:complete len:271 (-),score=54.24 TRINITY_DN38336_c0_g1_i1:333-1145(-)
MAATTSMASSLVLKSVPAALSSSRSSTAGAPVSFSQQAVVIRSGDLTCRAENNAEEKVAVSRRASLSLLAAAAALIVKPNTAEAAYGEAANVFGTIKKDTTFAPYTGKGFSLLVPAKWNPSKEIEFPGTALRYEDNFDQSCNLSVVITPAKKSSITDYGTPEKFLEEVSYLLGKQSYFGDTVSEGGFEKGVVSSASILTTEEKKIDGKDYYTISLLTRTADGDEGGKHQVITGAVSDGKLYVLKVQAGDKRWFKGLKKFVEGASSSFQVA